MMELPRVSTKLSKRYGTSYARWLKEVGMYLWVRYCELPESDQRRYVSTPIDVPCAFIAIENELSTLWKPYDL